MHDLEPKLTTSDIALLMEAIEMWEAKAVREAFEKSLIGSIVGSLKGQSEDEQKLQMDRTFHAAKKNDSVRKERAIILKAKLLQIRDSVAAEEISK